MAQDDDVVIRSGAEVSSMLETEQDLRFVPGQVIIKFRSGDREDADGQLRTMGFSEHLRATGGGEYVYSLPVARIRASSARETIDQTREAVEQMSRQPDVEYVQYNYIMHIVRTPNDPLYPLQWHYRQNGSGNDESPGGINLPDTWDRTVGSSASVVAVIDTGILPNHPDIVGSPNLLPGFDMISDVFTANDNDGRDADATDPGDGVSAGQCGPGSPAQVDSWHGTHVAGTVGVGNTDNGTGVAGVNCSQGNPWSHGGLLDTVRESKIELPGRRASGSRP